MLLSRRPSGLAFYLSSALLACFAITILYHLWGFDFRPQVSQTSTPSVDTPTHPHVPAKPDSKPDSKTDSKSAEDDNGGWETPPDLPNHKQSQPTPTPAPTPTLALSNATHTSTPAPTPTPSIGVDANGIPKRLWYKLGPAGLNNDTRDWTNSCINANPSYAHEFLTDESADAYVAQAFASRPDIVQTYLNLSVPILKADFLRYLLLFDKGGVWSDLDVSCKDTPIDEWVPERYRGKASLVVGWEFDMGWGDNIIRQFTSWTIMSRPATDFMATVIDDILAGLKEKMDEHNVTRVADLELKMVGDVVDITGPRRLTRGAWKSLEKTLGKEIPTMDFANLLEPKLIGELLIMPGYSFALSANKYGDAGPPGKQLVEHHYAGSWKNDKGGE